MENTENIKIPLEIPADERLYVTYALWSLAKHIKYAQDDFILEAAQQIQGLDEHMITCNEIVERTPKEEPYMLSPTALISFFICFDLCHKAMNGPEHFNLMMQYQDEEDEICVASFDDALRNKERSFELLVPFLQVMNDLAEKNPAAYQLHQYLRIAKRLPQPGSKGIRQEYAPFDEPINIPDTHPEFRLGKYHNSGINLILYRNIAVDMNFHIIFPMVKTIVDKLDNLPSRIINAYFPDFRHYFLHMTEHINLLQGTDEQLKDVEYIKKNSINQQLPEPIFGSIYLAFDFALKLYFSDKGYSNYAALLMDRFGQVGEQMFGKFAADNNKMEEGLKSLLPLFTEYFGFLTNGLDHKGSTLVADYQAFSKEVLWWD